MTNTAQNPFIVIGGGIGGLATALGVAENNQYVKVLEQAPEFGEVELVSNLQRMRQMFCNA